MDTLREGFPLSKPIRIADKHAGATVYDGPWDSIASALANIPFGVRDLGLTTKIVIDGKAVEYWWEGGKTDADLVQKNNGSGGGGSGSGSGYQVLTVGAMADLDSQTITESLYLVKGAVEGLFIKVGESTMIHEYNMAQYNNSQYK